MDCQIFPDALQFLYEIWGTLYPPPPPPPAILLMSKTWTVPKSAYASKTNKLVKKQFKYLTWTKLRVGVVISNLWNLTQNLYNIVSNTAMFWKVCFQDFLGVFPV